MPVYSWDGIDDGQSLFLISGEETFGPAKLQEILLNPEVVLNRSSIN